MSAPKTLLFGTALRASLLAGSFLVAGVASATDSFSDGSFGDGGGGASPAQPTQQGAGVSDNFGGSFDEGQPKPGVVNPQNPKPAPVKKVDKNDPFSDSSFEDGDPGVKPKPGVRPKPNPGVRPKPKPAKPRDPILAFEMRDFGVRPTGTLRRQQMHAPTPTAIPGGRLISTAQLFQAMKSNQPLISIDVLGGNYTLPKTYVEPRVAYGGSYRDRIQQQTAQWLNQLSRGNKKMPIVFFCSDPMCWMSYNASLRAINAGFTNVYWYRGGKKAWQMAGHQVVPTGF